MRTTGKVAALLFGSGACALIYQTVWMRQFRLIFGASTLATSAALAIFLGGLGIGSAIFGKRADAHPHPLRFYGNLELSIAASAAASPLILWIVARIYFGIGGSVTLGLFLATVLRLILATLVMGLPALLMGGTLPAAARGVESDDDAGRRRVALLYGANTLGAVAGTLASTFFMLEALGNRNTLFAAVVINVAVGLLARTVPSVGHGGAVPNSPGFGAAQPRPTLVAAGLVGFVFLLMELVWYRMLTPLLGGTTFTFGLILAIALLGIGTGGAAYSMWKRATPGGFALTCSLEAAAMALPFVLGDRLAVQENLLRSLGTIGFGGFVIGWTLLTLVVVFPPAFIAGVQFPLLISLLGRGRQDVGREVGLTYAWNTAGAIAGSLAGGFGLLPLLSAGGAWRLAVVLLALLGIAATIVARRVTSGLIAIISIAGIFSLGPTALWRHAGIGAGRAETPTSINAIREWVHRARRTMVWDVDGRESSVALVDGSDYAFIVNGKADGSARGDAGTQVMAGLVGAILHPHPQRALVIGLGTGSTAGWLGAVPSMQRVDVVELEPSVLRVAAACTPVNHDVLHNPKVHIRIADAREVLLATRERYDIIFSEPSNPYRAGVASLFTEEFYRASAARLNDNGIFLQWLQAYDVDSQTIRTIYATICAVFPNVETWQTDVGDLLLVGTRRPVLYDFDALRLRVASEPFRSALTHTWRVESLEGFMAHFVARDSLARTLAGQESRHNTDDRTPVEFGFARGLGAPERFNMDELIAAARTRHDDGPASVRGAFDRSAWASNRAALPYVNAAVESPSTEDLARHRAAVQYDNDALPQALAEWKAVPFAPINSGEMLLLAESLADSGSDAAEIYTETLRAREPAEGDAVLAKLRYRQNRPAEAVALLERAFTEARSDPWPGVNLMGRSLDLALALSKTHAYTGRLARALDRPFAAGQWEDIRKVDRVLIFHEMEGCGPHTVAALRSLEPWAPWRRDILDLRRDCYATAMSGSLAARARKESDQFDRQEPQPLFRPTRSPSGSSSDRR